MQRRREQQSIQRIARLKAKAKSGDLVAPSNIAAEYRILGRRVFAFRWWKKAAELGDGDAWLEVGYCYHHGIGAQRNLQSAAIAYDAAILSSHITAYGREEAMYHRAILLIQTVISRKSRTLALRLLRQANADNDYRQAEKLIMLLKSGEVLHLCFCRRGLKPSLGGSACCLIHR
jgi:TPR repeat protein